MYDELTEQDIKKMEEEIEYRKLVVRKEACLLYTSRLLGRHFFFSSLRCMLISSLMIDYVAPLLPVYSGDRLLAALCTGVFAGLGYAVIYMQNSSTGGSDFIIMAVKNLKPYWSVGKISFVTDVIIILLGGFLLRDVDGIIYGMIVSFLLAIVVDKLMYGINSCLLYTSIEAVFRSWDNPRANVYRRDNDIPYSWGTAVNVMPMVFGNLNLSLIHI